MTTDKFEKLFDMQRELMTLLEERRDFPKSPVNLSTKAGQRAVRDAICDQIIENVEAIQELQGSKRHRISGCDYDRDKLLEEQADVLHYFLEVCILEGFSFQEIYDAYLVKNEKNQLRIIGGY